VKNCHRHRSSTQMQRQSFPDIYVMQKPVKAILLGLIYTVVCAATAIGGTNHVLIFGDTVEVPAVTVEFRQKMLQIRPSTVPGIISDNAIDDFTKPLLHYIKKKGYDGIGTIAVVEQFASKTRHGNNAKAVLVYYCLRNSGYSVSIGNFASIICCYGEFTLIPPNRKGYNFSFGDFYVISNPVESRYDFMLIDKSDSTALPIDSNLNFFVHFRDSTIHKNISIHYNLGYINIPVQYSYFEYEYYHSLIRLNDQLMMMYVLNERIIARIDSAIRNHINWDSLGADEKVRIVCMIARKMNYYNADVVEHSNFPIESIAAPGIDCEDFSFLAHALLNQLLGVKTCIISGNEHAGLLINSLQLRNSYSQIFHFEGTSFVKLDITADHTLGSVFMAPEFDFGTHFRVTCLNE